MYETVVVPDIQTHPKHVYRVMWINIVNFTISVVSSSEW